MSSFFSLARQKGIFLHLQRRDTSYKSLVEVAIHIASTKEKSDISLKRFISLDSNQILH